VSQRLPISLLENVVSNAERRCILVREVPAVPRVSDIYAALPAITGKLELEYEGELQGAEPIAHELIRRAANRAFLERASDVPAERIEGIVAWFDGGNALKVPGEERSDLAVRAFSVVPGLVRLVRDLALGSGSGPGVTVGGCELVLEALAAQKRISRSDEIGWTALRPGRTEKRREFDD
jgi:magnesium chelatase subunit I